MTDRVNVTVYDGKYTVIMAEDGGLRALRYGEEWRDCCGDGLILALAQEVAGERELLQDVVSALRELKEACAANPAMQGREYVQLGIKVNDAIDRGTKGLQQ